jgi:hypothetical protein
MEHCDHLEPYTWKGEIVTQSCDPQSAWFSGRSCAESILKSYHVTTDYRDIFIHNNIDMLRPFPDGLYPGISSNPDPSVMTSSEIAANLHIPVEDDSDEEFEDECDMDADMDVSMDDILDEPPAPPELSVKAGDDWLGAVMISVKIVTEIMTAPSCGKYRSDSFELIYDPLVFDVFYLDKYPHEFSNFTDTIIQFF